MESEDIKKTWQQKLLFYTTAFFVLLGIFSLFSFLFLVPFVIDPAFTTIFMEFDEEPAYCVTLRTDRRLGASNCSWTSCREGCTKDIYTCTQIFVNYKAANRSNISVSSTVQPSALLRRKRAIVEDYDYDDESNDSDDDDFGWSFQEAKLFPNVKGCGYPPMLNCSIFLKKYQEIGSNFSCYYSRVDPSLVISHLDMWQVYMNLVYAMAIPIPSFIISVVYLAIAYFKIYNEDEEEVPLKKNAEDIDMEGDSGPEGTPLPPASGGLTPASEAFREDLASFGHHLKVAMVDDISRENLADGVITSISIGGNIAKTMTTSISTTGGPVADI
ncbi:protein tipE [Diorhabda carinulata]|uniref:protein tipE n=1 Tax=Diorhabda sublineata TaxID=1163346 RepID=UPI0024E0E088|nr:protein tipE [Diorhabda sublineata]XP_057659638.1 protein tipE [Diorhabda carinulata]